jgi:2-keto-3-deoxy-L-rhamnonate aldolase RhmA
MRARRKQNEGPPDVSDASLKERWRAGSPLVGFFARLKDSAAYEILAKSSTDFIIVDMEHGSFDRPLLAECLFVGRAYGLSMLVRVPDESKSTIQHAIGAGADGIIVPHVSSAHTIERVVKFVRTRGVERAYAGATRISSYRRDRWCDFNAREAGRVLVIAQIDEPPGVTAAQDIASVPGLDGLFLGQISLTLALGNDARASEAALDGVCRAAVGRNLLIGLSLPDEEMAAVWHRRGVTLFAIDSDQSLLKSAADARANLFRRNIGTTGNPTRES